MPHTLVFDLSNVSYIGAYYCGKGVEHHPDAPERIMHSTRQLMRQFYRYFEPDQVWFACDAPDYWRREIFPEYKGHRPDHLLKQQVRAAIHLFKQKNADLCLEVPQCEADDVIYAVTKHTEDKVSIVSSDRDFVQLISDRIKLFCPKTRQFRPKPKNPEYELFVKCIRGDTADNIPSAYPRVSSKRLQQAFFNEAFMQQLMQTRIKDGTLVADNYQRNRELIELSQAPADLQNALRLTLLGKCDQPEVSIT